MKNISKHTPRGNALQQKQDDLHYINRLGWLRASVLGANDGILSIASLLGGMVAGNASLETISLAGIAALAAGATSMATGEYVSVSSQSDSENAELDREAKALKLDPKHERELLAQVYIERGLSRDLANEVAKELMKQNALEAQARDRLGISEITIAKPLQAALASAASFIFGGIIPLLVVFLVPQAYLFSSIIISSLVSLAFLGALGAKIGGSPMCKPAMRVFLWGAISLATTTIVGVIFRVS